MRTLPLGLVVQTREGENWTYVGARWTTVGTEERVFARVVGGYWPHCLRTYAATVPTTLVAKFPALEAFLTTGDE